MAKRALETPSEFYSEEFRLLIGELSEDAIFAVDVDNRVRTWNPGVQRLVGCCEKNWLKRRGRVIFTPVDRRKEEHLTEMRIAPAPLEVAHRTSSAREKRSRK